MPGLLSFLGNGIKYHLSGRLYTPKPRRMTINITRRCNGRCVMCPNWKEQHIEKELTPGEIREVLSNPLFDSLESVSLGGGEPTMREDLAEVTEIILESQPKIKVFDITTNGLEPLVVMQRVHDIIRLTVDSAVEFAVAVSLDGYGATHDKIRGVPNAFDKVTETIRLLKELSKEAPFSICLNCVVQPLNIGELPQLYGFAQEMELPIHFIPIYVNPWLLDNTDDKQLVTFRPEQIEEIKLFFSNPQYDISPIWKAWWQDYLRVIGGEKRRFPCALLRHHSFLDTDGSMFICWADESLVYGNVRDAPADSIWYSAAAKSARQRAKAMYCADCTQSCDPALAVRLEFFHFTRFLIKEEGRKLLRRRPQMR